jgi:Protein of unknown function (DUF3025)
VVDRARLNLRSGQRAPASWDRTALVASPFHWPLLPWLTRLASDRFPTLDELNAQLAFTAATSTSGAPIRCVAPTAAAYEPTILAAGEVATRAAHWHDLFNALCWMAFPATKSALNALHVAAMKQSSNSTARGPLRDALTLFDESGVIVASRDATLTRALIQFQWKHLFWERRGDLGRSMCFCPIGHALFEKAVQPYHGMTGHALVVEVAPTFFDLMPEQQVARLDGLVAERVGALTTTTNLAPLPLLGVPGWVVANGEPSYYDDATQFRSGRSRALVVPPKERPRR